MVGIVDFQGTPHAQLLEDAVIQLGLDPRQIRWVNPSAQLATELDGLEGVVSVAIPVGIRGGTHRSAIVGHLIASIQRLEAKGIPVFISTRRGRPNALSAAGRAVNGREGCSASVNAALCAARVALFGQNSTQ